MSFNFQLALFHFNIALNNIINHYSDNIRVYIHQKAHLALTHQRALPLVSLVQSSRCSLEYEFEHISVLLFEWPKILFLKLWPQLTLKLQEKVQIKSPIQSIFHMEQKITFKFILFIKSGFRDSP